MVSWLKTGLDRFLEYECGFFSNQNKFVFPIPVKGLVAQNRSWQIKKKAMGTISFHKFLFSSRSNLVLACH